MMYGLRPVTNQISQDKKVSQIQHQKKHTKRLCSFQCNLLDIQKVLLNYYIYAINFDVLVLYNLTHRYRATVSNELLNCSRD